MTPGACAFVAGAHDHAPVRFRLLHTSAVSAVTVAFVVVAAGRSGAAALGAGGAGVGGASRSGAAGGVALADAGAAGSGWGTGAGSVGAGDGAGAGVAPGVADGADATRSLDEFELIKYQPTTMSTPSNASTAAIAGARDGSRIAAGALIVFGETGTADDARSGKSSSDGGAADRGDGGAAAFLGAAGGAFGAGGGGAGRGGGTDDADGAGGADEADGGGTDEADGVSFGSLKNAPLGAASFGVASFNGMPRAAQNCSRFSRLVVTNGSLAGKLEVAMA